MIIAGVTVIVEKSTFSYLFEIYGFKQRNLKKNKNILYDMCIYIYIYIRKNKCVKYFKI